VWLKMGLVEADARGPPFQLQESIKVVAEYVWLEMGVLMCEEDRV
jgi:hypothetical protein